MAGHIQGIHRNQQIMFPESLDEYIGVGTIGSECRRQPSSDDRILSSSVFINDDEQGLHADYEDWLEDARSKLRTGCAPTRLAGW